MTNQDSRCSNLARSHRTEACPTPSTGWSHLTRPLAFSGTQTSCREALGVREVMSVGGLRSSDGKFHHAYSISGKQYHSGTAVADGTRRSKDFCFTFVANSPSICKAKISGLELTRSLWSRLEKRENGIFTVLAEENTSYVPWQTYQLEIIVTGTTFQIAIDGDLVFSSTDSSFRDGTIALYSSFNPGSVFENVVVTDLATGTILLKQDFDSGLFAGWTVIDEKGTTQGPSVWSIQGGALIQSSNIGSSVGTSLLGTYAIY